MSSVSGGKRASVSGGIMSHQMMVTAGDRAFSLGGDRNKT